MLPKPVKTKKNRRPDKRQFQIDVVARDRMCMNPRCKNPMRFNTDFLHGHHVEYASKIGADSPDNGLAFCFWCHPKYPHPHSDSDKFIHPDSGLPLSGYEFVAWCVKSMRRRRSQTFQPERGWCAKITGYLIGKIGEATWDRL